MKLTRIFVAPVLAAAAGCVSPPTSPPAEQVVGERAMAQAEALMAADFPTALAFMTPAYRNSERAADFKRSRSGATGWSSAELKWAKCSGVPKPDVCEVRLLVETLRPPAMSQPIKVPLDDTWLLIDGEWYQFD